MKHYKHQLVSLEIANMAKYHGFNWMTHQGAFLNVDNKQTMIPIWEDYKQWQEHSKDIDHDEYVTMFIEPGNFLPVPTQTQLQLWFRQKYLMEVFVTPKYTLGTGELLYYWNIAGVNIPESEGYYTWEDALDAGFSCAFSLYVTPEWEEFRDKQKRRNQDSSDW